MTNAGLQMPVPLVSLVDQLEVLGFACSAADPSASFGDRLVRCEGPALAVRMVSDRGQWSVDVGKVEWGDWFDADVWKACIEAAEVPLEPRELATQAEYVALNVERLAAAAEEDEEVLNCLRQKRGARARRRLRLDDQ
jgi:hypothetical protein